MKIAKVMILTSLLLIGANANDLCGNGVKDLNEQCDHSDSSHKGWGNRGCDENCNMLEKEEQCDQTFYYKLRQGRGYTFGNYFFNKFDVPIRVKSSFDKHVYKSEQGDYNKDKSWPFFVPTELLKEKKSIINPKEHLKYITSTEETRYNVIAYPRTRSIKNFFLVYSLAYTKLINYKEKGYFIHTTCSHYEITRCGDGIKDWYTESNGAKIHELCDPNDPKKKGWGKNGCDNSCQPKN